DALDALRSGKYNAVIVDGGLSGAAAVSQAISSIREARPRLIRLTNFIDLSPDRAADEESFDVDLTKPLRVTRLHYALTGCLDRTQARAETSSAGLPNRIPAKLKGHVLIVDDQPLNREVAMGMLTSLGLTADAAVDGQEALERLSANRYDVVLMDCQMPVMDGYATTAEWRRRETVGGRIPIIALTADTTSEGRAACYAAGMDDYLGKPFSRATLHECLSR